jgi:hypothetical protein
MISDVPAQILLRITMKINQIKQEYITCPQHYERQAVRELLAELKDIVNEYKKS